MLSGCNFYSVPGSGGFSYIFKCCIPWLLAVGTFLVFEPGLAWHCESLGSHQGHLQSLEDPWSFSWRTHGLSMGLDEQEPIFLDELF